MAKESKRQIQKEITRGKIIDATQKLMLEKGFNATSIDEVCALAGITKGALFYHFKNKEELAKAVASSFTEMMFSRMEDAPFTRHDDPLEQVYGYLDFVIGMSREPSLANGCLLGNLAQEIHDSHPGLNSHCHECFKEWAAKLTQMLTAAKEKYASDKPWSPESIAEHYIAVYEGAAILAKAKGDIALIETHILHFKKYIQSLFEIS